MRLLQQPQNCRLLFPLVVTEAKNTTLDEFHTEGVNNATLRKIKF